MKHKCIDCKHVFEINGSARFCTKVIAEEVRNEYNGSIESPERNNDIKINKTGDCPYFEKAPLWTLFWR